jgi:hypothetical protein
MMRNRVTNYAVAKWGVSLLVAGFGPFLLIASISASQVPALSAQAPAQLCVTPNPMVHYIVVPNLAKGISGISSRYVITNLGSGHATVLHSFCTNEHDLATEKADPAPIDANDSRTYNLAQITDVPWGYRGYAVVQSDWPLTGTVLPPLRNVFLPLVPRTKPERDVRITYIHCDPPGDEQAGEYIKLEKFGPHSLSSFQHPAQ